jgi:hypothetical protein
VSTQSHGTAETVRANTQTGGFGGTGIAVDVDDIPHVCLNNKSASATTLRYKNKIGGSWTTDEAVSSLSTKHVAEIFMNQDDIPVVMHTIIGTLSASIGNLHNPTSFDAEALDTAGSDPAQMPSGGEDSLGNTHAVSAKDGDVRYFKHDQGDAWNIWGTVVVLDTGSFEDVSMAIDALDNIIIFATAFGVTFAWLSTDGGATFGSDTQHTTPNVINERVRLRWSYLNYFNPNKLDYTVYDNAGDVEDVYYNSASIGETVNPIIAFAGSKVLVS